MMRRKRWKSFRNGGMAAVLVAQVDGWNVWEDRWMVVEMGNGSIYCAHIHHGEVWVVSYFRPRVLILHHINHQDSTTGSSDETKSGFVNPLL